MTAATLMAIVAAATAGAAAGYILKHLQDNRWIREICNTYEETIEKINAEHKKETERLMAYINRQQQREIAKKMQESNPLIKAAEETNTRLREALGLISPNITETATRLRDSLGLGFPDINEPLPDLPEDWQEIDFGGNF